MRTVCSGFVLCVIHLEKLHESFDNKALPNAGKKLLTILIVFNVRSDVSSVELLSKKSEGALLSARVFIEFLEYRLKRKREHISI